MNLPKEELIQPTYSSDDVPGERRRRIRLLWWLIPVTGLLSLIWFLVRVIPKPSRAMYPCQRVAFPMASGFVAWLLLAMGSAAAFRGAKHHFARARYVVGAICVAVSIGAAFAALGGVDRQIALADDPMPNDPIGVARGIHPGRVVWVHDPDATDWDGPDMGDGHWWESDNTNMAVVETMIDRAIRSLAGEDTSAEAWDGIFRYFNQTQGKGAVGYQAGEKVTIKVNLVGCIGVWGGDGVDPATYDLVGYMDYMNTAPQMMLALLRQLVNVVGVNQADISIGDTLCYFPNQYYDMCHDEFPDVAYLDYEGRFGRTLVQRSSIPLYWSSHPSGVLQDYVPESYAQADYIVNMANFKSHTGAAVTLCGKNHYGSLIRWPAEAGYHDLHSDLPALRDGMGHYRTLVDLTGHAHIGGKTLLHLIDGLYAGQHMTEVWPTRLDSAPFNGDWSSSLFVSQDPVAIDSVAFDFLWSEPAWSGITRMSGGEDYLHEAAQADNPSSGTFYDPDHSGDVTRLASLGVHEHWNNPSDKQYSRNLGTGDGIELIQDDSCPPFEAPLGTGYNPVGPAVEIGPSTAENICNDIIDDGTDIDRIIRYNTSTGMYETHLCGLPINNFDIMSGEGYFIRSADDGGWLQIGCDITSPLEICLFEGYNPIALPLWIEAMSAEDLCGVIGSAGGSVGRVIRYNVLTGMYETHICGLPLNNYPISPGETCFIRSDTDFCWWLSKPAPAE